ncbi:MAG: hypothetical protein J3T61_00880, partial [Candidatus Brocadiales bacterium]|nr:hypothetical protein [Candidatus Bathyanammoxibius sp.]
TVVPPIRGESQKAIDVPLEGLSRATSLQRVPTITAGPSAEALAAERDRDEAFSASGGGPAEMPPIRVPPIVDEEERVPLIRGTPEQIAAVERRRRDIETRREENNVPSITSSRFGRLDPETREPLGRNEEGELVPISREEAERLQRERRTRRRVPTITANGQSRQGNVVSALLQIGQRRKQKERQDKFKRSPVPTIRFG